MTRQQHHDGFAGRARFGRNRLPLTTGVAALALVATGLSAGMPSARAADEIFIGGALCLTGIQAPLDEPGLRGAELAVKVINQKGGVLGKQLKFVNLDGKSDPVTVGNSAAQVIGEGAQLMVAPCDFDMGGPADREAQKAGIVGISTCASSPLHGSVTLGDKQFTLSMWNTTMGAAAAEYAFKDKGWKNAYVITDTFIDYTTSLSEYFIDHFKALGGHVIFEDKYTQGAQDFSAQLARLQRSSEKPDVLFISSYMPDLGTIIRTIRQAGIEAPVLGGDSYDDSGPVRCARREIRQRRLFRDPQLHGARRHAGDGGLPRALPEGIRQGARHLVRRDRLGHHPGHGPGGREGGLDRRRQGRQGDGEHRVPAADRQAALDRCRPWPRARHRGGPGRAPGRQAQLHRLAPALRRAQAALPSQVHGGAQGLSTPVPDALVVDSVSKHFYQLRAVDGVSLRLARGEILGLIGPNGSGKTTLINVVTGVLPPTAGRVLASGRDLTGRPAYQIARAGLARTFQRVRLFGGLSVLENVMVAAMSVGARRAEASARAEAALARMGVERWAGTPATALPYGHERMVEVARALAMQPRFLFLDEPAAGLNEDESEELLTRLAKVPAESGLGMLIVDHDMRLIMRLCHRLHVLNYGRTIAEGTPQEVRMVPEVVEAYLGAPLEDEGAGA